MNFEPDPNGPKCEKCGKNSPPILVVHQTLICGRCYYEAYKKHGEKMRAILLE